MADWDKDKPGMKYEAARKRFQKYISVKNNPNMQEALIDDVRMHDGIGAAKELANEFLGGHKFNCSGNKQTGIGEGKRCAEDQSFEKVGPGRFRKVYK